MSDITWKDQYGDAEGMAESMERCSQDAVHLGVYDAASDCTHAATALREQAAEIERLTDIIDNSPLDELHGCDCCGATTTDAVEVDGHIQCRACTLEARLEAARAEESTGAPEVGLPEGWVEVSELLKQARRVRNYSNPDQVFDAVPVIALGFESAEQKEKQ